MKRYLICLILLVACTSDDAGVGETTTPAPIPDTCGAAAYENLIGQPVVALEKTLILKPVRIIRPNSAVTLDYRADRINFVASSSERITRITCG